LAAAMFALVAFLPVSLLEESSAGYNNVSIRPPYMRNLRAHAPVTEVLAILPKGDVDRAHLHLNCGARTAKVFGHGPGIVMRRL